ncbi:MAG: DUF4340 domain-containing protein [Rhodospirillales bacterium]|nr:DUF4340 domain-containing protein [Rhodospirillales bacterium]
MNPRTFSILAAVTVFAVIAAFISSGRDQTGGPVAGIGGAVFPGLIDKVNTVAKVVVEHPKGRITLEKSSAGWTLKESDGYAARTVKIQRAILGLAELRLLEPKTRIKGKYAKLELQDLGAKDAKSRGVKLFDAKGGLMADVLVGKGRANLAGETSSGVYLRRPGDAQSWLAQGDPGITVLKRDWLERKIVNIEAKRIERIVVRHPDGKMVKMSKADPKAENFTLDNIPEGKKLIGASGLNDVARGLADLQLEGVRKKPFTFDVGTAVDLTATTFDGLEVRIVTGKKDGPYWMRIDAKVRKGATGDVVKETREITDRTGAWFYRISDFAASNLRKTLDALVEDAKPKS